MIARWNIVIVILLSLQLVNGNAETKESISKDSKSSVGAKTSGPDGEVLRRSKRDDAKPAVTPGTGNTTTTPATASKVEDAAKKEEKSSASVPATPEKPQDKDTAKTSDKPSASVPSTPEKPETKAATPQNTTKTHEVTPKTETTTPAINGTSTNSTKAAEAASTAAPPPYTFPTKGIESIDAAPKIIQQRLGYIHPGLDETNATDATGKSEPAIATLDPSKSNSTASSGETHEVKKESKEEMVKKSERIQLKREKKERLSGGIIALIASTVFVLVAVLGYGGMILRKKFIAYRQGTRELLVNDFDTNDTNTYEL